MALDAYLRLAGAKQGDIKGSVTRKGLEGTILVIGFNHEVVVPTDDAGVPIGQRMVTRVVITKEVDRSSPLLMQMLLSNETGKLCELKFYRPTGSGTEEQYFTIRMEGAVVVDIRQEMLNNRYPENTQHKLREDVAFSYRTITWTYEPEGLVCADSL